MDNMEKVIKGLECCMIEPGSCPEECPYRGQGDETEYCDEKIIKDVYTLLKAQKAESVDASKPDSDIGCWYDITHNYTLEQVVSALKARELCEDAVSRKYLLDQSYSIKFQTIDESDEEAYCEEVVCVEDIEDAPSVQPISVARVMTLSNLRDIGSVWELNTPPYLWMDINPSYRWARGFWVAWREIYDMIDGLHPTYDADNYGKTWRCWTSRPDEKRRAETPWERMT